MGEPRDLTRGRRWMLATLAVCLPLVALVCITLWITPYPIADSIGHFEDVAQRPASSFLLPTSSYYRPLFYLTLSGSWHSWPVADALTAVRFLHIVPVTLLVLLFLAHTRPANAVEMAAATLGVAVLVGSPGFRDNLEVPLSYTIVGMPAALLVWMLLERRWQRWHGPAIVALTLLALGFKEQGLVIVPLVIAAWWLGAPGAGRWTAAALALVAAVYVLFRLRFHDPSLPMFEQDLGVGFDVLSASDAEERFGAFPLWIYAYNAASTIGNILLAEPTEGRFRIVRALTTGTWQPWHVVHLGSSLLLTAVILWWGTVAVKTPRSADARLFLCTLVVVAATGALSFNYSRDRLGGMAVPFYALAACSAVRAAALRAGSAPRVVGALAALALMVLATTWQLRALYTLEATRQRAVNTEREWVTRVERRRLEFVDRPVYLGLLDDMLPQGTDPARIRRTRYPRWFTQSLGEY